MFYPFYSAMSASSSLVPTTVGSLDLDQLERTLGVFFIGYVVQMIGYGFTFFRALSTLLSWGIIPDLAPRILRILLSLPERSLGYKIVGQYLVTTLLFYSTNVLLTTEGRFSFVRISPYVLGLHY